MVRINLRSQHPGYLRQIARHRITQEINGKLWPERVLMQWRGRVLKVLEVREHVVGENAVQDVLVRRTVNLPGNAPRLKLFGHCGIRQAAEKRRTTQAQRLDHT